MYNFASSSWTEHDTQRARERIARMTDEELLKSLEVAEYMCSPRAYWGKGPRESYLIKRELVREERRRRVATEMGLSASNPPSVREKLDTTCIHDSDFLLEMAGPSLSRRGM